MDRNLVFLGQKIRDTRYFEGAAMLEPRDEVLHWHFPQIWGRLCSLNGLRPSPAVQPAFRRQVLLQGLHSAPRPSRGRPSCRRGPFAPALAVPLLGYSRLEQDQVLTSEGTRQAGNSVLLRWAVLSRR